MLGLVLVLAGFAVLIVYAIGIYNGLVKLRENVRQAWANIDVLLKQRHDELPKLVETCKRYMQYEQETLERVMRARSSLYQAQGIGNVAGVGAAESQLRAGIGQLLAVAENYPALKADEGFRHLATRITGLEEQIADRRELYNEAVNLNNIRIQVVPDVIVARLGGFTAAQLLEFSDEEKRDVDMKDLFNR
jgi:LemA protein